MYENIKIEKIECLGDLRKYNTTQLFQTIFMQENIDPEYAFIAAWHINHIQSPKNHGMTYNRTLSDSHKVKIVPLIPDRFMKQILKLLHYNKGKTRDKTIGLLPEKPVY